MTAQHLQDPGKGKYFHQMLNMADDDLNPYEYRLLGHYIRVAAKKGRCWESVRTTALTTRMSVGMVVKTRNQLLKLGYIHVKSQENDTCIIRIIDRMKENVARYADLPDEDDERSPHEHPVHHMNTLELVGVHQVKQRRIRTKEEDKETTLPAAIASGDGTDSTHSHSIANEADDMSMFPLQGKTIPSQAEKVMRAAQTPSFSLEGIMGAKSVTDTTPLPQSSAAPPPRSIPVKVAAIAEHTPLISATLEGKTPATPKVKQPAKRSEKQLANDALIEALRIALAVGRGKEPIPLEGPEISNYSKVANALVSGGVSSEDFLAYVQYWNVAAQTWPGGLTLNSLIKPGRITDFKTWFKTRKKPISGDSTSSQVSPTITGAKRGYDKRLDPAYAHLYETSDERKQAK